MRIRNHWREMRERKGLSLARAAEIIGITRQGLHKIEKGDNTTSEKLARACALYKCQPSDLYEIETEAVGERVSGRKAAGVV